MALVGAAPEDLEQLACAMGRGAEHLRSSVSQTIGSQLQSSPWEGGDADQFRHDWASRLNPLLLHAVEALQAADTALRKEAREQRVASDESAVSAPAGIGRFAPVDHSDATRFTDPLPSPFVDWGGWSKLLKNDSSVIGTGVTLLTFGNLAVSKALRSPFSSVDDLLQKAKTGHPNSAKLGSIGVVGSLMGVTGATIDYVNKPSASSLAALLQSGSGALEGLAGLAGKTRLSKALGPVGSALGATSDFLAAFEKAKDGDGVGASLDIVHGVANGAGVVFPPVALCVAAWDTGSAVGTVAGEAIMGTPAVSEFQDAVVAYGAARAQAEGTDIGTRYEGLGGVVNIVSDHAAVVAKPLSILFGGK